MNEAVFISNSAGNTMQAFLDKELSKCDRFIISVAFISRSGLAPLKQTLLELENRKIPGRILTTDYLTFTEPSALRAISRYSNIELKIFRCDKNIRGFHTKGYLFFKDKVVNITIGSSNLTGNALAVNKEWNTCYSVEEDETFCHNVISEFEELWNSPNAFSVSEDILAEYSLFYNEQKRVARELQQQKIALEKANSLYESKNVTLEQIRLEPNSMQLEFVRKLKEIRAMGEHRALLISATGTGKTYAAAFALRDINPKRALFLVHREQILSKSIDSFKNVFGDTKSFGLYSGNSKETEADFVFATMQTMERHVNSFNKNDFQVIVIDEAHHAGAPSYIKMMDYFKPDLWLGMTASPDKKDCDIYALFDHNIAHEIRLQEAMRLNLLCPFHYYGITDFSLNGEEKQLRDFNYLTCDARVKYIIEKAKYFGHSGNRLKGLAFCSRLDEAEEISKKFNSYGYRTIVLSGDTDQDVRKEYVRRLEVDNWDEGIDYIFTVDIFNEGIDIPEINQVLMLRPTQSPIVFVQQLGRGLRKAKDKEYVMVLDFIGNYSNNYMIPIALSGDRTYNKDNIRRYVRQGVKVLEGASTIHFDEISRKRIYESIDSANFSEMKLIKECYKNLKYKLGRIPSLMDYEEYGEIDVLRIFENASLGSYHNFLKKVEKDEYKVDFSKEKEEYLKYVSTKFANGKRLHELLVLRNLLCNQSTENVMVNMLESLKRDYNIATNEKTITNVENILTGNFASGAAKEAFAGIKFIEKNGNDFCIASEFLKLLKDEEFYRQIKEVVDFGFARNKNYFGERYKDTSFCLYSKYTYEDVCRLLDWEKNEVPLNIGGYKYDKNTNTFPVFVNYDKDDDVVATQRYEDRFADESTLVWISKSGRTSNSDDVKAALHADDLGIKMDLFVRKNKDDHTSKEFYYLGRLHANGKFKDFTMPNTEKTAVEITYNLETPVRQDIYDYLVG